MNYGAGTYTLDKEKVCTRYVAVAIRTLVDPTDPKDLEKVQALQDQIKAEQAGFGRFEVPNWDPVGQKKARDALLILNSTIPDFKMAFGMQKVSCWFDTEVNGLRRLVGNPGVNRHVADIAKSTLLTQLWTCSSAPFRT